jgi:hypothetical protein
MWDPRHPSLLQGYFYFTIGYAVWSSLGQKEGQDIDPRSSRIEFFYLQFESAIRIYIL